MLIFGWRTRSKVQYAQQGKCPVCQTDRDISFQTNKIWFTLFFVPVFPIRTTGSQNVCGHCGSVFPSTFGAANPPVDNLVFRGPHGSKPPTTAMTVIAFLLAILSPALICISYSSIMASGVAILLAHLSLRRMADADGRQGGRGFAIASLVLAYPVLLGSVMLLGISSMGGLEREGAQEAESAELRLGNANGFGGDFAADAESRFQEAERQIMALQGDSPGRGNSPAAIKLAESFAEMMLDVREVAFSNGKKPLFQLTDGQFITYVELHRDSALFLVHVPEYRKFSREAKKELAELAWSVAQLSVQDSLNEDSSLAVAMKGTLLYGDIMTGYVTRHEGLRDNFISAKKADLLSFFPAKVAEQKPLETSSERAQDVAMSEQPTDDQVRPDTPPLASDSAENSTIPTQASDQLTTVTTPHLSSRDTPQHPALAAATLGSPSVSNRSNSQSSVSSPAARSRERFELFAPKLALTPIVKIPRDSWGYESLAWSNDGKWLAAGRIDDTLSLFDAGSGETLSQIKKLTDLNYYSAVSFSYDDRFLVAATNAGDTAMFEVDSQGRMQHVGAMYRHGKGACVMASSPRYPFVASGGKDGTIVWQTLAVPSQLKLLQHLKREPLGIWLPTEGTHALAINGETRIQFSLLDASIVAEQAVGVRSARAACFSPDGSQCVLLDYQDICWSDCRTNVPAEKIYKAKGDSLSSVVFHPNNRWIAVCGRGNVLLLDVLTREPLVRVIFESVASVKCLQFSPDGGRLAVSFQSSEADIYIFDIQEL